MSETAATSTGAQPGYFISTSIPYVNGRPHVGHALEFALADTYARWHRQQGDDVFFLSGSDENSLKNVQAAEALGIGTQELVDRNVQEFVNLLNGLEASNDDYLRTSVDPRHAAGSVKIWEAMVASGDVYTRTYSGLYCVGCEQFYTPDELDNGRCPEHGTVPDVIEEENWFFRLSRYSEQLGELIRSDQLQVVPQMRKNEILRFIEAGLEDFSISRSDARARGWGIRVPNDPGQVMYVWIDALANYITALDYATDGERFDRYWTGAAARVHGIGKGILRFHAAYWPGMLLAAGLPLPTHVVVHGYLTTDGQKMSKSLGNVVDPLNLVAEYGADAVRFYLLREISPFADGDFNVTRLLQRYNSDLANDLGNLFNRSVSMLQRYRGGVVPMVEPGATTDLEDALVQRIAVSSAQAEIAMEAYDPQAALAAIWEIVTLANAYVEQSAPWTLAKAEKGEELASPARLDTVLATLVLTCGQLAGLLQPFLPGASVRMAAQLGLSAPGERLQPGMSVAKPQPIFPRIDIPVAAEAETE